MIQVVFLSKDKLIYPRHQFLGIYLCYASTIDPIFLIVGSIIGSIAAWVPKNTVGWYLFARVLKPGTLISGHACSNVH